MPRSIEQFEIGAMRNFLYLVIDWPSRQALLVDTQKAQQPLLDFVAAHGLTLVGVLLTHTHHDHVAGLKQILDDFDVPIYLHRADAFRLETAHPRFRLLDDGARIDLGETHIELMHTPGHSAGGCCYRVESSALRVPHLLTGDTIFIRDCGRTDLPTGDVRQMFDSIQRIKALPPETVILPGHHYTPECSSTLADELRTSPPFQCVDVDELARLP